MQRILSKTLQSYGFKSVFLASDGFEGIAIAVEETPHLIILDIMMPDLSGHLTLKVLKQIRLTKHIPVLMVSALSDTENLGMAVKSGTAGFISKPFTRSTIYEKLVHIYGKYNLDKIAKGEMIEFDPTKPENMEESSELVEKEAELMKAFGAKSSSSLDINEIEKEFNFGNPKVSAESLRDQYKEEEQKSLDTIKKLLFKTKK
jgi:two-component system, chemotaxis family, chemotaxis protein CheY